MSVSRFGPIWCVAAVLVIAFVMSACGSRPLGSINQVRSTGSTSTSEAPLSSSTTSTEIGQSPNTTIINPSNYHPNYGSIGGLASTSTAVFVGTVQPFMQDPSDGGTVAPMTVDRLLLGVIPRSDAEPELPQAGPDDVPVVVGHQYLVFWGVDSSQSPRAITTCVIGGSRGLFSFDPGTQTVSRISATSSQIPATETLAQVVAQLPNPDIPVPTPVPTPPICAASVTGG
jgi:hypothetical protein